MKTVCFVVLALCFTGYVRGQAAAGASCNMTAATPVTCATDLYCETDICKIKIDGDCSANTDECVMGATCDSTNNNVCKCPAATHTPSADNTKCLVKIGEDCSAEGFMCAGEATCNNATNKCDCPDKSTANAEKNMCLKYFGESCTESTDCVQSENMKCTDKKCACTDNKYIPSDDFSMCRLKAGETCTGTGNECGANAKCNDTTDKCHCDDGFEAEEGRCGKKVGETCGPNMPCVLNAMCNSENKCACKDNYTGDGGFCRSGSTAVVASVLLLIAALVTSRLM